MSFPTGPGILTPTEMNTVQRVYDRVLGEPWFVADDDEKRQFAAYVIRVFDQAKPDEDQLFAMCAAVARERYTSSTAT